MDYREAIAQDTSKLEQKWDGKSRPYPYDTGVTLTVLSNADTAEAWGDYVKIIPKTTYAFAEDVTDEIRISGISIETVSDNGIMILEFSRGDSKIPVGAVRISRSSVQTRSFMYEFNSREVNATTEDVWVRMKSTPKALTVTFSVMVKRHLKCSQHVAATSGVFPFA